MDICSICNFKGDNFNNVYHDYIYSTSTPIIEVIVECLQGTDYECKDDFICEKCLDILQKYYETTQLAQKIKNELLSILFNSINKIPNPSSKNINYIEDRIPLTQFELSITAGGSKNHTIKIENNEPDILLKDEEHLSPNEFEIEFLSEDEGSDVNVVSMSNSTNSYGTQQNSQINCTECSETFNNQRNYRSHYKKVHFSGYICDQCGKTLHSYSGFFAHRQMHDPIKPYECSECGERFRHNRQLNYHRAWHTGEKPFHCEICSKQFVHRIALHKHKKIHDNTNRRFICDVCSAKFRTSAHLRRHMMTHTGAKPHCCHICGKCFAQAYNMRVHLKEHQMPGSTRQRRYKCQRCKCTFTNKKNFESHTKQSNCIPNE